MRKEIVGMIVWCAIIVLALVAQITLAVFLAERSDVGTSDNSLVSDTVDGDSDSGDVRERFEGVERLKKIAVITDSETGVQYLYVRDGFGRSGDTGGLVVLVDADGNPLIAEEAAMAPSNQAAGER